MGMECGREGPKVEVLLTKEKGFAEKVISS